MRRMYKCDECEAFSDWWYGNLALKECTSDEASFWLAFYRTFHMSQWWVK